jgi:hypothetical protein
MKLTEIFEKTSEAANWGIEKRGNWKDTCFEYSSLPHDMEAKLRDMVDMLPEVIDFISKYRQLEVSNLDPDLVQRDSLIKNLKQWGE